MQAAALLQLAIQLLPAIQVGVTNFIRWMQDLRTAAQQDAQWTAEQDEAFVAAVRAKTGDPAYQPDAA